MSTPHIPVLLDAVLDTFKDTKGWIVDATLGFGGHSEALLQSSPNIKIIGIDRDKEALAFAKKRLEKFKDRVVFMQGDYSKKIKEALYNFDIKGVLADIGVSSWQLDSKERGFSFESDELDMRMDRDAKLSAYEVLNYYSLEELAKIFKEYGEIRDAKRVAKAIIANRPIQSAKELAHLAKRILPAKKIHPATTLFQAIRIEVNKELDELTALLDSLQEARLKDAKIAIITFHSLEDRIVKNRFKEWAKECICPEGVMRCECGGSNALGKILTKKPIIATSKEKAINPRSRSAKMRVFWMKESNGNKSG